MELLMYCNYCYKSFDGFDRRPTAVLAANQNHHQRSLTASQNLITQICKTCKEKGAHLGST